MTRRAAKVRHMPGRAGQDRVTTLLQRVQQGEITGERFCAEVTKLEMADRTRLLASLLREYKDLNNFTPATDSEDKVAS
jgi:hypothetical protein